MERPIFKPVGTPVEELDTPSLIVDLALLDHNIETVHGVFRNSKAKLRPHVEPHRTPAIAHRQLAAGGTVGGVAVSTVGQAEVFVANGITDVFVANLVVSSQKIARLCALAQQAKVRVLVDSLKNVGDLSDAAAASGVTFDVAIAVNTRGGLYGIDTAQAAVGLARAVTDAPGLEFAGIATREGRILVDSASERESIARKCAQQMLDFRAAVEKAGIPVKLVSMGGTTDYEILAAIDGVTEVVAGTYALMEERCRAARPNLKAAGRVMVTVTSRPEPGYMITDGGQKSIGADSGNPSVDNLPSPSVKGLSAEHGSIFFEESDACRPKVGDKIWHTPFDIGSCANLHDYIFAVRNGKLVAVWDVAARGRYR